MTLELTKEEQAMLDGEYGRATQKAMEILTALGEIYGAKKMLPVTSVQISGVSYANLGEPGLKFLNSLATDGKVRVLTTLNPAGMDLEEWEKLGISEDFAKNQLRVIAAFQKMGVVTTATCTPYLVGNIPHYGEHIAWAESSAVAFANSVIGARTNREGGPSALAAALTGRTPAYGYHLDQNRKPQVIIQFEGKLENVRDFGALGKAIAEVAKGKIVYIKGVQNATIEELKGFSASIATYGGVGIYHIERITPEWKEYALPDETITLTQKDVSRHINEMSDEIDDVDFVTIGCPHASLREIEIIAELLKEKKVTKEMWITTSRPVKEIADQMGYTKIIENAGAKIAADTCAVVAPIKGRFKGMVTNSAKACYYARGRNNFKVQIKPLKEVIREAIQ